MRHFSAGQPQIHNTKQPFAQNQPGSKHNHRRLLPPPPPDPIPRQHPSGRPRQRERGGIVHAHRDCDSARHVRNPPRPLRSIGIPDTVPVDPERGEASEDQGRASRVFGSARREALSGDQPRGEDPYVPRGDLEQAAGDTVHFGVEFVDGGADESADAGADELAVELRFGACAEEMAGLEVLEEVAGLQGAGFGDRACDEVDGYGVSGVGRGDQGEDELGEFADPAYGVQVRFAQCSYAHYAEEEGEAET